MKRLTDLTAYAGVLPYASEVFGIYQPLLGWRSQRVGRRITAGGDARLGGILKRLAAVLQPDFTPHFNAGALAVDNLAPALTSAPSAVTGVVGSEIRKSLPPHAQYTPAVWATALHPEALKKVLVGPVLSHASAVYRGAVPVTPRARALDVRATAAAGGAVPPEQSGEAAATSVLRSETRTAGLLQLLGQHGQYALLEKLFYNTPSKIDALWTALANVYDPFATIDPQRDLARVGLSPVGVAHLFREYFFELDTFLGSPVGHVWISPGASVELYEVHTRRVLTEQTLEQSVDSLHKSETDTTQQEDLSDAVKEDNKSNTKLGVNVSSSQNWGFGSASESASFGMDNTQERAREQTHKSMRQQSSKLSTEIKKSFKSTFRTVTESTDVSSKRYVLANGSDKLVNYELRRKMRQVAVQVQDIGSYLCWQTYVDDPGRSLGVSRLVHVGTPPDLSQIPPPDLVVPPQPFSEDVNLTIPFIDAGGASNDDTFDDGAETSLGILDSVDYIVADIRQGPVRCSQPGFRLAGVVVDAQGADALITVDPATIQPDKSLPDGYTFLAHLKHINFDGKNSMPVKATLYWAPIVDEKKIQDENDKLLDKFSAREKEAFKAAFIAAARERIKLASNLAPRRSEDLREEERIVVYRALVQDMLEPAKLVPQPDAQTQHVVAELLDSIFDVDKMLYFVAPEWWRPRLHRSEQELGSIDPVTDQTTGKQVGVTPVIPAADQVAWGDAAGRPDNYFVTEDSTPARLGSSLGWLLQLDGDDLRNAFLNAPWVKAVLPIRPGQERAALNWLQHVEGTNGIGAADLYEGPEPEWKGTKTVFEVLGILADTISAKHAASNQVQQYPDPMDPTNSVSATPVDRVYEHGFDPLKSGFQAKVNGEFEVFDQWIEVLPTDQVAAVEVTYDPKTGRQL